MILRSAILILAILFVGCTTKYTITRNSIKSEWVFSRGFEISQLEVSSLHAQKNYPIDYNKTETHICLIRNERMPKELSEKKLNLQEYWEIRDSIDYNSETFLSKIGSKKINFFEAQNQIQWFRFSANENVQLSPVLELKFELNNWYKLSRFYPKQYDLEFEIFIYVKPDGDLKIYQKINQQ
jgi:hypothetical protein